MDANKDGTIDQAEWEQHMTPELRAAITDKLQDSGIVAGFKPLVDIARVFDQLDADKYAQAPVAPVAPVAFAAPVNTAGLYEDGETY